MTSGVFRVSPESVRCPDGDAGYVGPLGSGPRRTESAAYPVRWLAPYQCLFANIEGLLYTTLFCSRPAEGDLSMRSLDVSGGGAPEPVRGGNSYDPMQASHQRRLNLLHQQNAHLRGIVEEQDDQRVAITRTIIEVFDKYKAQSSQVSGDLTRLVGCPQP
ncbi:hypothetical protein SODALDRAFT_359526 [Sodiomyces alkalinus F11]|uniref:Uncharacterized protein n=1 Tax=Sodiomyces alkalinus (strain CBS 110278 / VKM F-3762 / F11) TaxID=1314773 RepID=A0A3N2PV94_SODAK|nr:hypothetical protein SODALDRAFT_359526 [Sodiomyces alkalinus F11]ROT38433.1 hypothetical protein SODALDRAFT_359526 [Sodiomyces alkalinus F11]